MNRPCISCGVLIPTGSRCPDCRPQQKPSRPDALGRDARWQRLSKRLLRMQDWCTYCSDPATSVDHIIPVSKGGSRYDINNLAPACMDCNRRKGNR